MDEDRHWRQVNECNNKIIAKQKELLAKYEELLAKYEELDRCNQQIIALQKKQIEILSAGVQVV